MCVATSTNSLNERGGAPTERWPANERRSKVCIVATVPLPLNSFMAPHILSLSRSYDLMLVVNGSREDLTMLTIESYEFFPIPIQRKVAIWSDLICLLKLIVLFRRSRPSAIHSLMPKSGLLSMIAARFARVPVRIHTFTGQVWASKTGVSRGFLKTLDKLLASCATVLLTDSRAQRDFLVGHNVCSASKIEVLGPGSMAGVDVQRFTKSLSARSRIRKDLEIPEDAFVYLFLGRLNRDKGVTDLAAAFSGAANRIEGSYLVFVGHDEENLRDNIESQLQSVKARVRFVDWTTEPEAFMSAADIFCLPSYREGFPSTVLEAAVAEVPTVCSRIYGTQDAVIDGVTGLMHEPGDIHGIEAAMISLYLNADLKSKLARNARDRAVSVFAREVLVQAMDDFYCAHVK
jgi:glycosyltransferase involved in cell wall biosynthesis